MCSFGVWVKRALIVLMLISLGGGWILYWREHNLLLNYQNQQDAASKFEQTAKNQTPGLFDRLEGGALYFRTPIQVETDRGLFVNYQDQGGTVNNDTVVLDASGVLTNDVLQTLETDTQLYLDLTPDTNRPGWSIIRTVYIIR